MDAEPNPDLLNRQPKWFKSAFRWCIVSSVLFIIFGLTYFFWVPQHRCL